MAAPSVCPSAVRPAIVTVSVYCSPETVDPSPYDREKSFPTSFEVELELGSYVVWPEHVEPQSGPGRKRSLEPVSKSTVYSVAGVPTEILPYQSSSASSVRGSLPESARFFVFLNAFESGWVLPVLRS